MRLLEAIVDANHRATAGDTKAGLHPADFANELPLVALTCIDARLNDFLPGAMGVPKEQFIWLRNAGNIITGLASSTMRSLALACAVKGGKEIVIIGHSDCQVGKTTTMQLLEKLKAVGVERHALPDNLAEFFGMFGTERQNVIKAAQFARQSPLIGPRIPVHGLLMDIATGKLEWIVNGYEEMTTVTSRWNETVKSAEKTVDSLKSLADFKIGDMKFPETKIGETVTKGADWLGEKLKKLEAPADITTKYESIFKVKPTPAAASAQPEIVEPTTVEEAMWTPPEPTKQWTPVVEPPVIPPKAAPAGPPKIRARKLPPMPYPPPSLPPKIQPGSGRDLNRGKKR